MKTEEITCLKCGSRHLMKTTPRWKHLGALLRDDYLDARRVVERLHQKGYWEEVPRNRELLPIGAKALTAKMN